MQSKATTVAAYLRELPNDRRNVMTSLCALARKVLVGFDEGMEYGMPYYKRESQAVGICSQKKYISVYGLRKQVVETGVELDGAKAGKSCINFTKPELIDLKVIQKLLVAKQKAV
ncbi:MAG: DUF1801 domain-containing protein [Gemmatimonadota bacterium]|nr:DUF1801 domain-containing protein [Gemmatimonadota bacterium]